MIGDGVNVPVGATGVIGSHRIASDLHKRCFRRAGLRPIRCHVDPVLVAIRVKEVHDHRAWKGLASGHLNHAVRDLRAFILDVRNHVLGSEWRIGNRRSTAGNLNRIRKAEADLASGRVQRPELPITPNDAVVAIGRQEAGDGLHAVDVGTEAVTLDVSDSPGSIDVGKSCSDWKIDRSLRALRERSGRKKEQQQEAT